MSNTTTITATVAGPHPRTLTLTIDPDRIETPFTRPDTSRVHVFDEDATDAFDDGVLRFYPLVVLTDSITTVTE